MAVTAVVALGSAGGAALAAGGIGAMTFGALTGIGAFFAYAATSAALGLALNALTPKPKGFGTADAANRGYQVTARGTALDHQVIYGKMKVAGAVVFDGTTGSDNKFLHRVLAFTGHEIDSFNQIYVNDALVTNLESDGNVKEVEFPDGVRSNIYDGKLRIRKHLGTPNQTADTKLVSAVAGWGTNHRLRGIAYLYARLKFDPDVFPNGVPEITSVIKGKKVYDPRTGSTAWSDNPALCMRDYLTNTTYGLGEEAANIDDDLVTIAANVCDYKNYPTLSGGTRYTCDGSFTTAVTPYDMLSDLLTSMGGLLWYAQGKWRMKPAYWTAPVMSLGMDDLRSSVSIQTRHSRRDNFNVVKGTFRGEVSNWQVTDYPQVTDPLYVTADGGQESVADINLPFTSDPTTAQQIGLIALERNRQQITISASFGLNAFQLQVGDNVTVTNPRFGWVDKEFEVTSWTFGVVGEGDLHVQMNLRETAESIFDEISDATAYERDNTTLLSPFEVPPVGISNISGELRIVNEQVVGVLSFDATSQSDLVDNIEAQYRLSGSDNWLPAGISSQVDQQSTNKFEVTGISDGDFDVRARATNTFGIKGAWTTVTDFALSIFANPPQDVENFSANVVGNTLHLSWTPVSDLDLSHYKLRYSPLTSGAEYQKAVDLVKRISRPANTATVPAQTGTYFLKALDKLGNVSLNPASIVIDTNVANIDYLNVVATRDEDPAFDGAKDGVVKLVDTFGSYITLDTGDFDEVAGDFDDKTGLFDGGDGVLTSGTYDFNDYFDLGETYVSRVVTSLNLDFLDYGNSFDSAAGLFDSREGLFDGDATAFDTTSVKTQVSVTFDDPAGSPTWSDYRDFIVGDITARAFKFRAVLESGDANNAPAIRELSVFIDMPDRVESASDITYTGTTSVTFPSAFKETPAIGISAALADGDRYLITSKSRTGFTITTYTGASVSTNPMTFDYVAKGYGKEIT